MTLNSSVSSSLPAGRRLILAASCAAALTATPALAGPFTGSVSGTFSAPVLAGNVIDPVAATSTFTDNTTTAACNLGGCPVALAGDPAKTVNWGNGAFSIPTSTLSFTGVNFTAEPANTPFTIGHFTYLNGTSDLSSLIFGATLTLTLNDAVGGVVDTKVLKLAITTTSNTGNAAQNADFVQFPATATTLQASPSMNVYEGASATFDLTGEIVGDPTLQLLSVSIAPGSQDAGFVGTGAVLPEPGTMSLVAVGITGLMAYRRRRRA